MNNENLINVEKAVSFPQVVKLVQRKAEEIAHAVLDVSSFEYECYVDIGRNLLERDEHKSISNLAIYHIRRKTAKHLRRSNYKVNESFEVLAYQDDEGSEVEFEAVDVLANVEGITEEKEAEKEMIALLAKGDRRKSLIIESWINGHTNDLDLSDTLASVLGGNSETHRKCIQRFRNSCMEHFSDRRKEYLSQAI